MDSKVKFFSKNVAISKKDFNENCDKLNYQRKLIRDIEKKHKEWANNIDNWLMTRSRNLDEIYNTFQNSKFLYNFKKLLKN